MADLIAEFTECLNTMSHSRAGWDYELSREQKLKEDQEERVALARAKAIWAQNPDRQGDLITAFKAARPLATLAEIDGSNGARK